MSSVAKQLAIQPNEGGSSLLKNWLESLPKQQAGDTPDWLHAIRNEAAAALARCGLPHRKVEDWRYVSLQPLDRQEWRIPAAADCLTQADEHRAAAFSVEYQNFVAGNLRVLLKGAVPVRIEGCADGVQVSSLKAVLGRDDSSAGWREALQGELSLQLQGGASQAFSLLNSASLEHGLVIEVEAGMDAGILSLEWQSAAASQATVHSPRVLVRLAAGARLELREALVSNSAGDGLLNRVVQIELGKDAQLQHVRLQEAGMQVHDFSRVTVAQQTGSAYRYTGFELGGGMVRQEMHTELRGEGAECSLAAAFVGMAERVIDHHLCIEHIAGKFQSEQFLLGALAGHSRGVFNGKAIIRPGADGSRVRQSNANLLLSDLAEMNTKPELEIYADEVEASHGATVGQLDESAAFYLRSRGISERQARQMLTAAFCRAVAERLDDVELAEFLVQRLDAAMPREIEQTDPPARRDNGK